MTRAGISQLVPQRGNENAGNEPMMSFRRLTVLATLAVALALPFAASAPAATDVIVVPPGNRSE